MRAPFLLLAMAVMHSGIARADAPKAPVMGTTIVQQQDAAIGLFLAPWKDETTPARERPPGMHQVALQPADAAADRARTAALETVDSYQRARRQSLR